MCNKLLGNLISDICDSAKPPNDTRPSGRSKSVIIVLSKAFFEIDSKPLGSLRAKILVPWNPPNFFSDCGKLNLLIPFDSAKEFSFISIRPSLRDKSVILDCWKPPSIFNELGNFKDVRLKFKKLSSNISSNWSLTQILLNYVVY